MKFLMAVCFSVFATSALACNDFSGKFRDEKMEVYTILQSACVSVAYIEDNGDKNEFIVDGEFRLSEEEDGVKIFTAANFIEETLVYNNIIEYDLSFPDEVPEEMIPRTSRSIYSQDSLGNLANEFTIYNSSGAVLWTAATIHEKV